MLAIIIYTAYTAKRRDDRNHFFKWGPTYLVCIASLLIMLDLLRHVLQDQNVWPEPGSRQYQANCDAEFVVCLSSVGWVFTIFATYIGFVILMWGSMWNANLVDKLLALRAKWRELRGTS